MRASSAADAAPELPGWIVSWTTVRDSRLLVRHWSGRRAQFARIEGGELALRRLAAPDHLRALVAVIVVHAGIVRLAGERSAPVRVEADTATLLRLDRPMEVLVGADVDLSVAVVPLGVLESRGIETRAVDGTTWSAGVIEHCAVQLANHGGGADPQLAGPIEAALLELIVGVLAEQDGLTDDAGANARARAVAVINERYADPDLDADAIAKALGVSRRYLYSRFEGRDLSVAALIRRRRVAHAQELLAEEADLPLRQIAQLSGLGSEDRLLRTFKTVLNMSPSAYRRAASARVDPPERAG